MRQLLWTGGCALGLLLLVSPLVAQDTDVPVAAEEQRSLPYEIVVTPMMTRTDLRGLIQQVEDDFFNKFNELNIDESYDIVCYKMTPPMTHISQRVCEPLFLIRARSSNSSEATYEMGTQYATGPFGSKVGSGMPAVVMSPEALRTLTAKDFEILQEKMEELNRSNDELRSIGSVLAQLKSRLQKFGTDD